MLILLTREVDGSGGGGWTRLDAADVVDDVDAVVVVLAVIVTLDADPVLVLAVDPAPDPAPVPEDEVGTNECGSSDVNVLWRCIVSRSNFAGSGGGNNGGGMDALDEVDTLDEVDVVLDVDVREDDGA